MFTGLKCSKIGITNALSFLEYLARNKASADMLANYISAIRAKFVILGLDYTVWQHPTVKYLIKSLYINHALTITKRNVIDTHTLVRMTRCCDQIYMGPVFKISFLFGLLVFLCLSNLAANSVAMFVPSRNLLAADVICTKEFVKK